MSIASLSLVVSVFFVLAGSACTTGAQPPVQSRIAPPGVAIIDVAQVDTPPIAIAQARPIMPESMRTSGARGSATVECVVGPDGLVYDVRAIQQTHPDLGQAGVVAVMQWRFRPARVNGEPVWTRLKVPIEFSYVVQHH